MYAKFARPGNQVGSLRISVLGSQPIGHSGGISKGGCLGLAVGIVVAVAVAVAVEAFIAQNSMQFIPIFYHEREKEKKKKLF